MPTSNKKYTDFNTLGLYRSIIELHMHFNPDFAVGFVMRVSNAIQELVSGYFLGEEIVNYFEVKKCSSNCYCAAVGSRNRISTAKSGFNSDKNKYAVKDKSDRRKEDRKKEKQIIKTMISTEY